MDFFFYVKSSVFATVVDNAPLCCHPWKWRCPQHYRCSVLDMKPRFTFKAGRILCAEAKLQKKERKKKNNKCHERFRTRFIKGLDWPVQCTVKHVFDLLQVVGAGSWIEWGIFAKDTFQREWRCLLFQFTHSAPPEWRPRSDSSISEPVFCLCGFHHLRL